MITSWNRAAEEMFGFTPEEAIGSHISIIVPDDRLAEEAYVLSQIRRGLGISHFETRRHRKDGTLIDIELTVSPIRNATGTVIGASKIARDITEQKRLRQAADETSRMKDEFLSVFSHELRTPVNVMLGNARLLQKEISAEYRAHALDSLERNAQALARPGRWRPGDVAIISGGCSCRSTSLTWTRSSSRPSRRPGRRSR